MFSKKSFCALIWALSTLAAAVSAEAQIFAFEMRGAQEVPPLVSIEQGGCFGVLDQPGATFTITCTHNVTGPTLIHIHRAPAGANGPILHDLGDPTSPVEDTWTGMAPGEIADLLAGNLYVNIHSSGRPDGQLRGQIVPRDVDMVSFTATGAQQVPPDTSLATASCTADLSNDATELQVDCTHDVADPTVAHIHRAPVGENGPVVYELASATSPISFTMPMTPRDVADYEAGFLYLNIHSVVSPDGEIRGQLRDLPPAPTLGTIHVTKATSPAGGTGFGFSDDVPGGPATFDLDDGGVQTFSGIAPGTYQVTEDDPGAAPGGYLLTGITCTDGDSGGDGYSRTATIHLTAGESLTCTFANLALPASAELYLFELTSEQEVPPEPSSAQGGCAGLLDTAAGSFSVVCVHDISLPTMIHIHRGPVGGTGPVIFDLGDPTSPVQATWTGMTAQDVADLQSGNLYLNIHTAGRPNGAIRGQIVPRTFDSLSFPLAPSQVVPPAGTGDAGSCTAELSGDAALLTIGCDTAVPDPIDALLRSAPRGVNGPQVFDFGPVGPSFGADVPTDLRLLADLVAGFLYVEVDAETAEGVAAAARGQIDELPQAASVLEIPALGTGGAALLALALLALAAGRLRRRDPRRAR